MEKELFAHHFLRQHALALIGQLITRIQSGTNRKRSDDRVEQFRSVLAGEGAHWDKITLGEERGQPLEERQQGRSRD